MLLSGKLRFDRDRRTSMLRLRSGVSCALAIISFYSLAFASSASAQVLPGRYIVILQDPPVSSQFETRAALNSSQALIYCQQNGDRQDRHSLPPRRPADLL